MKAIRLHNTNSKGRYHHINITCRSALALLFLCFPAFTFVLCGCSDTEAESTAGADDGCIMLHISAESGDISAENSGNTAVDVFIYNDDDLQRIDSYQRMAMDSDNILAAASRKGGKIIAVISDPQQDEYDWSSISSFESLCEMTADLAMEKPDNPLRSGIAFFEAGDNGYCELALEPVLSEIHIRSIRCDFSGKPYSSATMKNACIYLANINSLAGIFDYRDFRPKSPVNSDGYPTESFQTFTNPEMVYAEIDSDIGTVPLNPGIRLYCYPNCSETETLSTPYTRLVISGEIEGRKYYYPININKGEFGLIEGYPGIARNCRYTFDITIRQTGNADPTRPVSPETVSIKAEITPWDVLPEADIEF